MSVPGLDSSRERHFIRAIVGPFARLGQAKSGRWLKPKIAATVESHACAKNAQTWGTHQLWLSMTKGVVIGSRWPANLRYKRSARMRPVRGLASDQRRKANDRFLTFPASSFRLAAGQNSV